MDTFILHAIQQHAIAEYPREACGLVVHAHGEEDIYIPCRNIAEGNSSFVMAPEDYAAAEERGEITMLVHTHPDASSRPSEADRVVCSEGDVPWLILSVYKDVADGQMVAEKYTIIEPDGYVAPLVGRQWGPPRHDCYSLIRDYYQRELGIDIPDFELAMRTSNWWEDPEAESLYVKHFEEAGFVRVDDGPKLHDVIMMDIRSKVQGKVNHAGIYLGDNPCLMLHHLFDRPSSRVPYGGYWLQQTVMIVRHKSLLGEDG